MEQNIDASQLDQRLLNVATTSCGAWTSFGRKNINHDVAKELLELIKDDGVYSTSELETLHFLRKKYRWTIAAKLLFARQMQLWGELQKSEDNEEEFDLPVLCEDLIAIADENTQTSVRSYITERGQEALEFVAEPLDLETAKLIIQSIEDDGIYDSAERFTIERLDAVYTFAADAKAYLTERLSILSANQDNSENIDPELDTKEQIVDDLDPELITLIPFGTVIDAELADTLFEFVIDDDVYSNREKKTLKYLRNNRRWASGVQQKFNHAISGWILETTGARERGLEAASKARHARFLASLDEDLLALANKEIDLENAKLLFEKIRDDEFYSDKEKKTIAYLRSDNSEGYHFTREADAWFRREIMSWRAEKAHISWLNNVAEPELIPFLDKQPLNKKDAKKILAIIQADGQYSEREKATMRQIYLNEWDEDALEWLVESIHRWSLSIALDGALLDAFQNNSSAGIFDGDLKDVLKELLDGNEVTEREERTLAYCYTKYAVTKDMQDEIAKHIKECQKQSLEESKKKIKLLKDITENLSKHVLEATDDALSERSGKITINGVEKIYNAIIRDGKYTKREQRTMAYVRREYVFTKAADKWFRTSIRRFVAKKAANKRS